jgi:putative phosphoesterase
MRYCKAADEIWHAGDVGVASVIEELESVRKKLRGVYGNIDGTDVRKIWPENEIFVVEGVKVLIRHICGSIYKYTPETRALLAKHKPDILVCGHSHICKVQMDKRLNTLYMNPGAAGKYGFHQMRTMLRFQIENGKAKNLEVIELGERV